MVFVILLERTTKMKTFKYYLEKNKIAWNKRTPIHIKSKFHIKLYHLHHFFSLPRYFHKVEKLEPLCIY